MNFDNASEMNDPPKPMTADMTSSAFKFKSTPFSASMPSIPKSWKTTLIKTSTAALVARNRKILIMVTGTSKQFGSQEISAVLVFFKWPDEIPRLAGVGLLWSYLANPQG